jgi:MoaA/NifB/PqqE/SkfB family radical SAM enzyme
MYNNDKKYKDYPSISAQVIEEDNEHFGCTAGGTDRFYINAKGDVQPCEFLNLSFGNIQNEKFSIIYDRMRNVFNTPCQNLICEKISNNIYKFYKDNNLKTLPLTTELSKQIYEKWNRGDKTEFYKKIEDVK